jgi:FlaA1/EpsC-like NDP-sugar epimerase
MNKKLIVFGAGDMADLAHYYFTNDTDYDLVAFTVDEAFVTGQLCCGLPVVAFEQLLETYPPSEYSLFIALSYSKLNQVRRNRS